MIAAASFVVILPNKEFAADSLIYETLEDDARIMKLLDSRGEITRRDVEALLRYSSFPANNIINKLISEDKITRVGSARATKYVLK